MTILSGEAALSINDEDYTLVLDFEALISAEQAYGKPLAVVTMDAQAGFVGALRCLLFGALRRHHPDVTLAASGQMMAADAKAVETALEQAARLAYPEEDKKPGKAPRPRGNSSGRNGARRG